MTENTGKAWYKSLTIRALIAAVLAQLLVFFGVGEQQALGFAGKGIDALLQVIELSALGVAAWGRKRATQPLTLTKEGG